MRSTRLIIFLAVLFLCLSMVSSVRAASGNVPPPTSTPTPIILATPSPSPSSNDTATPTPTPFSYDNSTGDNSTTVIYDSAVGVVSVNPNGQTLFFSTYNQTVVALTYANAVSYTSNVTSLDYNHFEYSRPTSMSVTLNGVNTYIIHFQVLYDRVVNQSISLTITNGDGKSTVLPLSSFNRGFTLDVTVTTSILPHYPTAQEQAEANAAQNALLQQNDHNFIQKQMGWVTPTLIIVSVVVILLVVGFVLVLRWASRKSKSDASRTLHGYGYGYQPKNKNLRSY